MLGAGGEARTEIAGLTDVEVAVLRRGIASLVETLSTTWLELAEASVALHEIESSPVSVQLVPPSEPTLVLAIDLTVGGLTSTVRLVLPYRSLEPVIERIANPKRGYAVVEESSSAAVRHAMRRVEVELRAEVGDVELTLAEVRELRPGDVVRLRRPASKGVVVRAGEVPAYVASPGRNGNARAIQIREPWSEA
jgi:flagellar motor switch protein FliM